MLYSRQSQSPLENSINAQIDQCTTDERAAFLPEPDSPVSVEELSPGSLRDLMRRKKPSLCLLAVSPSFSLLPALCRRERGWRGRRCPWSCSLAAEKEGGGTGEEPIATPRLEAKEGWNRISGMENDCWLLAPPMASSWEQLRASTAWRRSTGDLVDRPEDKSFFVFFFINYGFNLKVLFTYK